MSLAIELGKRWVGEQARLLTLEKGIDAEFVWEPKEDHWSQLTIILCGHRMGFLTVLQSALARSPADAEIQAMIRADIRTQLAEFVGITYGQKPQRLRRRNIGMPLL